MGGHHGHGVGADAQLWCWWCLTSSVGCWERRFTIALAEVLIVVSMELVLANLFMLGVGCESHYKGESGSGEVRKWGAGIRDVGGSGV